MNYDVQNLVKELGERATALRKSTVTIVGLGGIGSSVAELFARAGINLRIIDKDRVYEEDLPFLSLFSQDHISKFKAKEAKKILENINKDIKVKAFHEELMENNAYLVGADVIIDCSRNMKTSILIDKAAKKKPVIYTRAIGCEGHLLISKDNRIRQITSFLEKMYPYEKQVPVLGTTTKMVAALALNKALKILTKAKFEKNYLVVNGWKFTINKHAVKKNPAKKKK